MGHPRQTATCCICGATFEGTVRYALVSRYCSAACRNEANKYTVLPGKDARRRGETAAILPSENYLPKAEQFTDAEFWAALKAIKAQRKHEGKPAVDTTMQACKEKPERIAAAKRRRAGA